MTDTWVKVCGLTNRPDVEHAVSAGADAVGFVVYAGSPRFVPPDDVAGLAAGVSALTVILTVDTTADDALEIASRTGVGALQPYGRHAAAASEAALARGLQVLRPVRATPGFVLPDTGIPLLDTPHNALHGGTGESFDWNLVCGIETDFVLAGGLGPDNVAQAVAFAEPWGVDASSGLEADPGRKDPGKVTAFIEEAKRR